MWDERSNMGGCGDWCKKAENDLYSRVCDAYESGVALANHIVSSGVGTEI